MLQFHRSQGIPGTGAAGIPGVGTAAARGGDAFRQPVLLQAGQINGAWRVIKIGGLQLHIYEVIKVAMVMYLAWAVDAFQKKEYRIANLLSKLPHFHWLGKPGWQKIIYIYAPMFFVMGCVALGSGSSAAFIGFIMFVTILVGGLSMKELIAPAFALVAIIAGILLINKVTDGKMLEGTRIETWVSRLQGSGTRWKTYTLLSRSPPSTTLPSTRSASHTVPRSPSSRAACWAKVRDRAPSVMWSRSCTRITCSASSSRNTASSER